MEFGILLSACAAVVNWSILSYHDDDNIDDDSFRRRFFFFFAVKLSWPLSVFESSLSDSLDELELDDDDDELELLELSDAKPVASFKFTFSANSANSGSLSYCQIETIVNRIHPKCANIKIIFEILPWALATIFLTALVDRVPFCATQWENWFCCRNFVSQLSYHLNSILHANIQVAQTPFHLAFVKFQLVGNL